MLEESAPKIQIGQYDASDVVAMKTEATDRNASECVD